VVGAAVMPPRQESGPSSGEIYGLVAINLFNTKCRAKCHVTIFNAHLTFAVAGWKRTGREAAGMRRKVPGSIPP